MLLILALVCTSFALSACALYLVWNSRRDNRERLLLRCLLSLCLALVVFLVCPWYYSSVYLRFLLVVLVGVGIVRALLRYRMHDVHGREDKRPVTLYGLAGISSVLVLLLGINSLQPSGAVNLQFPLRGYYCVMQGGGRATNPFHQVDPSGRYAVDIVALNCAGNRADGLFCDDPSAYAIYGDTVYSPCDGVVQGAVGNLPDTRPGNPDVLHPPGNHLVIQVSSGMLLLAHLQQGSLRVSRGMAVKAGQPLAQVGNSGNSAEPHLHVHLEENGGGRTEPKAIPLLFEGRYLVLNDLVVR